MMVEFVHVLQMSLEINVMFAKLVGIVSHLVKVRFVIFGLNYFLLSDKYLQNVNVMQLVQSITVVLMMVEFVLVLLMSLVLNVILVKLVGLVSHLVKVRYIIISGQPNLSKIWYYSIFRSAWFCLARFCSVFSGKPNQISIG